MAFMDLVCKIVGCGALCVIAFVGYRILNELKKLPSYRLFLELATREAFSNVREDVRKDVRKDIHKDGNGADKEWFAAEAKDMAVVPKSSEHNINADVDTAGAIDGADVLKSLKRE